MMMFFSVMAKMILSANNNCIKNMKSKSDQLICNVLIDYQNREGLFKMKQQSIVNDYVSGK